LIQERYKLLSEWTEKILNSIWSKESIEKLPKEVRIVAYYIAEEAKKKEFNITTIVCGYLILR
jgi:ribosomal protein L31E